MITHIPSKAMLKLVLSLSGNLSFSNLNLALNHSFQILLRNLLHAHILQAYEERHRSIVRLLIEKAGVTEHLIICTHYIKMIYYSTSIYIQPIYHLSFVLTSDQLSNVTSENFQFPWHHMAFKSNKMVISAQIIIQFDDILNLVICCLWNSFFSSFQYDELFSFTYEEKVLPTLLPYVNSVFTKTKYNHTYSFIKVFKKIFLKDSHPLCTVRKSFIILQMFTSKWFGFIITIYTETKD